MTKNKLLFVIGRLDMNGASKSLIALLDAIKTDYDIWLFLFSHNCDYKSVLPPEVKVLPENRFCRAWRENLKSEVLNAIKRGRFLVAVYRLFVAVERALCLNNKFSKLLFPKIDGDWDVACAYTDGFMAEFVAHNVHAKKKLSWIHCDYTKYPQSKDTYLALEKMDGVVSVSQDSIEQFKKAIGREFTKPLYVIHNIIDADDCKQRAEVGDAPEFAHGGGAFSVTDESHGRKALT